MEVGETEEEEDRLLLLGDLDLLLCLLLRDVDLLLYLLCGDLEIPFVLNFSGFLITSTMVNS